MPGVLARGITGRIVFDHQYGTPPWGLEIETGAKRERRPIDTGRSAQRRKVMAENSEKEMGKIVLFPITSVWAWRTVEAVCLRKAGGANASIESALTHLRLQFRNAPAEILEPELEHVRAYMKARITQHKQRCGLVAVETLADAGNSIETQPEPPPAA